MRLISIALFGLAFACNACSDGDRDLVAAPDEARSFAVERSTPAPPAPPPEAADAEPKVDPLVELLNETLTRVILGQAQRAEHEELRRKLVAVLEEREMGSVTARFDAADLVIRSMFRAVDDQGGPARGPVTSMMRRAIQHKAETYADDLYRRLPRKGAVGLNGQHDGTLLKSAVAFDAPAGYEKVSFAELGAFPYEEGKELPESVTRFGGKKVAIAGYMMTLEEVENIREFLLVESLWSCCFGQPPLVNQVIVATMPKGKRCDYTPEAVMLVGALEVGEEFQDGFVTSLYRLKLNELRILK